MKTAGPSLFCLFAAGTLAAAEPAAPSGTSARLSAEIRAGLPAFSPPPARPKDTPVEAAAPAPDVLQLPTFIVREKVRPRIAPNDLMTPGALNRKFAADYKKSLTGLDAMLNGFAIPLFGPSLAARGRAQYRAGQYRQMFELIDAIATADPRQAAALRAEMINLLAGRPPGSK